MAEKVATPKIPLEKGWTYFIDGEGDVARTQDDIATIGRGAKVEKVARIGLRRQDGYFYYVDREGDIARMARDEWQVLNHEESTQIVPQGAPRNRSLEGGRRPQIVQAERPPARRRPPTSSPPAAEQLAATLIEEPSAGPPGRAGDPPRARREKVPPPRRRAGRNTARPGPAEDTERPEEKPTRAVDVGKLARSPVGRGAARGVGAAAHDAPTRRVDVSTIKPPDDDEISLEMTEPVLLPERAIYSTGLSDRDTDRVTDRAADRAAAPPAATPPVEAPQLPDTSRPSQGVKEIPEVDLRPSKRMRALSLRQPWAELVMRGVKTREVRSRPTTPDQRIYIYASKGRLAKGEEKRWSEAYDIDIDELPRGMLVGTVEIADCVLDDNGYLWILAKPERARRPLQPKNRPVPGLFHPY
jgi:hypothetical protein